MGKPKPSSSSLQEQLTKARNELELSTFLNKGVLQTNSEQKLRIAELEMENETLRKAESMLASTEEERDRALERLGQMEDSVADLDEQLKSVEGMLSVAEERAQKGDAAVERLSSVQRKLRRADEATEAWRVRYHTLLSAVETSQRIFAEATPAREADPHPRVPMSPLSTRTPSQPAREREEDYRKRVAPRSRSRSKRRRILSSDMSSEGSEGEEEEPRKDRGGPGPGSLARRPRRGARYEGSGDDAADESYAGAGLKDERIPPRTLPRRERQPPPALPSKSLSSPVPRMPRYPTPRVPATAPRRTKKEGKSTTRQRFEAEVDAGVQVKSEPESDMDPLGDWDDEFISPR